MRKHHSRSGDGQEGQGKDNSGPDRPDTRQARPDRRPENKPQPKGFNRGQGGNPRPEGLSASGQEGKSDRAHIRSQKPSQENRQPRQPPVTRHGESGFDTKQQGRKNDYQGRPTVFPGMGQAGMPYGRETVSPLSAHAPGGSGAQRPYIRRRAGYTTPAPLAPAEPATRIFESLEPSAESLAVIAKLGISIDEAQPLSPKHRASLRQDIRKLWEELTSNKESRNAEYLGSPASLSAYVRYFLPWNVFRLSAIFSNADFCLPPDAVLIDIGSGPLTMPIALYVSRPELRDLPLTIYCMDRVERIVEAGRVIFETLCLKTEGRMPPWTIKTVRESFGAVFAERAHLVTAVNVFNEFFWKSRSPLGERAIETARTLLSYTRENGSLFVMEPGDPRSGAFISALRAALITEGASPLGPCPHAMDCPMPGIFRRLAPDHREDDDIEPGNRKDPNSGTSAYALHPVVMPKKRDKYPWCHFGIGTEKAPSWLSALSEEAGLPKDRAVLSYLWVVRKPRTRLSAPLGDTAVHTEKERRARAGTGILVRVVSDPFALGDGACGQYACSNLGYTLLRGMRGSRSFEPGTLLELQTRVQPGTDEKSGAIILPY